jgi:hypothetical protein
VSTGTFYPEDFGARGDGVTNDTAAVQACLDAAVKAGGGTVQFGPKTYLLNSVPRHDRGGNAILALPYSLTSSGTLRLQGVAQATNLATTVSGLRFSPELGCPSIVGGPTPEQLGRTGLFSFWNVELIDLNVLGPHNSTLCGVDLIRQVRCSVRNLYISTVSPTASRPTAAYGFGLRLPDGLNFARVSVEDVDVYGFYTGFVVNTAHARVSHAIAKWCVCGYGLTGSGQLDAADPHASLFELINSEFCAVHMAGWSHAGVGSLAHGHPFYVIAQLWDIEDAPRGRWYSTYAHLIDANNQLFGHANYMRVRSNVGAERYLVVEGGKNVALSDLNTRGGLPGETRTRYKPRGHRPVRLVQARSSAVAVASVRAATAAEANSVSRPSS